MGGIKGQAGLIWDLPLPDFSSDQSGVSYSFFASDFQLDLLLPQLLPLGVVLGQRRPLLFDLLLPLLLRRERGAGVREVDKAGLQQHPGKCRELGAELKHLFAAAG